MKEKVKGFVEKINMSRIAGLTMGMSLLMSSNIAFAAMETQLEGIFGKVYSYFFMGLRLGGFGLIAWGLKELVVEGLINGQGQSIVKGLLTISGGLILTFTRSIMAELLVGTEGAGVLN